MAYLTVTDEHLRELQVERVHALELDHARLNLVLAEEVDEQACAALGEQIREVQRRIAVHVAAPEESAVDVERLPVKAEDNAVKGETSNETVTPCDALGE